MVLDHVPDGPRLFVEAAPLFDPEILGHGDLDAAHVVPIPDGLQKRIGEAGVGDVLHRLLAQEVVDAEDGRLGVVLPERVVELDGRAQVAAEGLLYPAPGSSGCSRRWPAQLVTTGKTLGGMAM